MLTRTKYEPRVGVILVFYVITIDKSKHVCYNGSVVGRQALFSSVPEKSDI